MIILNGMLTYLIVIPLTVNAKAPHSCMKTDLDCYSTKDYHPKCRSDENCAVISEKFKEYSIIKELENGETMASNRLYRPRSALARALYEKQRNDRHLQEFDKNEWYRVDRSRLDPVLQEKFVQLHPDDETKEFLSSSVDKSTWVWTQLWYLLAKAVLKHFWSVTDINGWLGRGSMFVLSEDQARSLLHPARSIPEGSGSLVDVGAGDGEVSRRLGRLYGDLYATEISASMRKALGSKGYTLLDTEEWWREQQFDCVCMMNLLDRCSKPKTMLRQAKTAIAPGGVLVLALVLPYKPYVEVTPDHKPEERLPIQGASFEEQVGSFVTFMAGAGYRLRAWARAPYLCEGDFAQAYYWLDDSVYVFTPEPIDPDTNNGEY